MSAATAIIRLGGAVPPALANELLDLPPIEFVRLCDRLRENRWALPMACRKRYAAIADLVPRPPDSPPHATFAAVCKQWPPAFRDRVGILYFRSWPWRPEHDKCPTHESRHRRRLNSCVTRHWLQRREPDATLALLARRDANAVGSVAVVPFGDPALPAAQVGSPAQSAYRSGRYHTVSRSTLHVAVAAARLLRLAESHAADHPRSQKAAAALRTAREICARGNALNG